MNKGLDLIQRQQSEIIDGYPTGNVHIGLTFEELEELEQELKEYEQCKTIEKGLGIEELSFDLITLFKHRTLAQMVGYVWYKTEHPKCGKEIIIKRDVCTFQDNGVIVVRAYDEDYVCGLPIKDYGKTWALTREELL